jgi:hypothetical protein
VFEVEYRTFNHQRGNPIRQKTSRLDKSSGAGDDLLGKFFLKAKAQYTQTSVHAEIERNLISPYLSYVEKLVAY